MMIRILLLLALLSFPLASRAQLPTFTPGQTLTAAQLNAIAATATAAQATASAAAAGGVTVTATGSTTARMLADRAASLINVRDFGAKCDRSTDDWQAFSDTIARVNTLQSAGTRALLYVPPGMCIIGGGHGPLPAFALDTQGGAVGAGPDRSWVLMAATYTGALFQTQSAWMSNLFPDNGNTINPATNVKVGPFFRDISIVGDRTASAAQYGISLVGPSDFVSINNVDMFYINGGCLSVLTGMRESRISNLRCFNAGLTNIPAIELSASGTSGGGPNSFDNIDIYAPQWTGLHIRNNGTFVLGNYKMSRVRIEGQYQNPNNVTNDLLEIGDPVMTGAVGSIAIDQLLLINPYTGGCAMRVTGPTSVARPTDIIVKSGSIEGGGGVTGNQGNGLCLDAVRNGSFTFETLTAGGTEVTIGALAAPPLTLDLNGAGPSTITYSIDPAAQRVFQSPVYVNGDIISQKMSFGLTPHDGSVQGGNTLGVGAVDLQLARGVVTHAATSTFATIGGGQDNLAGASSTTIAGGISNQLVGQNSASPGGGFAADQGRAGTFVFGNGLFLVHGDAQLTSTVLRGLGSGTAPIRLTSGGAAANNTSSTANCLNVPANYSFGFSVRLHARDFTTPGTEYDWFVPDAMLTRQTSLASTALALGTPVVLSLGTITGAAVTATADTTNGCLSLTFTPPSANTTDTWHAVARIEAVEVQ